MGSMFTAKVQIQIIFLSFVMFIEAQKISKGSSINHFDMEGEGDQQKSTLLKSDRDKVPSWENPENSLFFSPVRQDHTVWILPIKMKGYAKK